MVVLLADGEVIIHYYLLQYALVQDPSHVDAVFVDLEIREDRFYAVLLLSQTSDCAEEVTVSYATLKDVVC